MVLDADRAMAEGARAIGVNEGTPGNWVAEVRRERSGETRPCIQGGWPPMARLGRVSELGRHNMWSVSCARTQGQNDVGATDLIAAIRGSYRPGTDDPERSVGA